MGICLSTTKVSGSNSGSNNNNANHHRNANKEEAKRRHNHHARNDTTHKHQHQHQERAKNYQQLKTKQHQKTNSRRQTGVIPCGKRTDFGYDKDFDRRYTIGKLLGHGQFGYTYVATDKANGDRVAVKKIEKNKVLLAYFYELGFSYLVVFGLTPLDFFSFYLLMGVFRLN